MVAESKNDPSLQVNDISNEQEAGALQLFCFCTDSDEKTTKSTSLFYHSTFTGYSLPPKKKLATV